MRELGCKNDFVRSYMRELGCKNDFVRSFFLDGDRKSVGREGFSVRRRSHRTGI